MDSFQFIVGIATIISCIIALLSLIISCTCLNKVVKINNSINNIQNCQINEGGTYNIDQKAVCTHENGNVEQKNSWSRN